MAPISVLWFDKHIFVPPSVREVGEHSEPGGRDLKTTIFAMRTTPQFFDRVKKQLP